MLTEYALQRTPNSEEAHLWRGWGRYRNGDVNGAVADFRAALEVNPNNWDAIVIESTEYRRQSGEHAMVTAIGNPASVVPERSM